MNIGGSFFENEEVSSNTDTPTNTTPTADSEAGELNNNDLVANNNVDDDNTVGNEQTAEDADGADEEDCEEEEEEDNENVEGGGDGNSGVNDDDATVVGTNYHEEGRSEGGEEGTDGSEANTKVEKGEEVPAYLKNSAFAPVGSNATPSNNSGTTTTTTVFSFGNAGKGSLASVFSSNTTTDNAAVSTTTATAFATSPTSSNPFASLGASGGGGIFGKSTSSGVFGSVSPTASVSAFPQVTPSTATASKNIFGQTAVGASSPSSANPFGGGVFGAAKTTSAFAAGSTSASGPSPPSSSAVAMTPSTDHATPAVAAAADTSNNAAEAKGSEEGGANAEGTSKEGGDEKEEEDGEGPATTTTTDAEGKDGKEDGNNNAGEQKLDDTTMPPTAAAAENVPQQDDDTLETEVNEGGQQEDGGGGEEGDNSNHEKEEDDDAEEGQKNGEREEDQEKDEGNNDAANAKSEDTDAKNGDDDDANANDNVEEASEETGPIRSDSATPPPPPKAVFSSVFAAAPLGGKASSQLTATLLPTINNTSVPVAAAAAGGGSVVGGGNPFGALSRQASSSSVAPAAAPKMNTSGVFGTNATPFAAFSSSAVGANSSLSAAPFNSGAAAASASASASTKTAAAAAPTIVVAASAAPAVAAPVGVSNTTTIVHNTPQTSSTTTTAANVAAPTAAAAPSAPTSPQLEAVQQQLEATRKELTALKEKSLGLIKNLVDARAETKSKDTELNAVKGTIATLKAEVEQLGRDRDAQTKTIEALQTALAEAREEALVAKAKEKVLDGPLQQLVVDDLSARLKDWFDAFAAQQQQIIRTHLKGIDANDDDDNDNADAHDRNNDDQGVANNDDSAAAVEGINSLRSVQGLRDFFATRLISLAGSLKEKETQHLGALAEGAAKEAIIADLGCQLVAANETITQLKANDGAHVAELEAKLADSNRNAAALTESLKENGSSLATVKEATETLTRQLDATTQRYTALLAAKEVVSGELAAHRSTADIALGHARAELEAAKASHDEAVQSLQTQITSLTALSTKSIAEVNILKRQIALITAAAAEKEREADDCEAAATMTREEQQRASKATRTESKRQRPHAARSDDDECDDEEHDGVAAKALLASKPLVFGWTVGLNNSNKDATQQSPSGSAAPSPTSHGPAAASASSTSLTKLDPSALLMSAVNNSNSDDDQHPKLAALRAHAASLGLSEPTATMQLGAKRGRTAATTTAAAGIPSFAEAAAFFARGKEYIAAVSQENAKLRHALSKALAAGTKAKAIDSTRAQTVSAFAALHEEIDHLRADNKSVRDRLAGVREENSVLTAQLVSTLIANLNATTASSTAASKKVCEVDEAVASPIAPLPPANLPFPSAEHAHTGNSSPRLLPKAVALDAPTVSRIVTDALTTIRWCATEISQRNSSTTTSPEVQLEAAKRLQAMRNETMRLTRHKEGLLKLIEPREKRLAAVTAHLIQRAAAVSEGAEEEAAVGATGDDTAIGSPSSALFSDAAQTGTNNSSNSRSNDHTASIEAAVALALGFAEEQRALLCVASTAEGDCVAAATASAAIVPSSSSASATPALMPRLLATQGSSPSLVPAVVNAATGAVNGAFALDGVCANTNATNMNGRNAFVAKLITRCASLADEVSNLKAAVAGLEGSSGSAQSLAATHGASKAVVADAEQHEIASAQHTIAQLRAELSQTKAKATEATIEAATMRKKGDQLAALVCAMAVGSEAAMGACGKLAEERNAVVGDVSKWRAKALAGLMTAATATAGEEEDITTNNNASAGNNASNQLASLVSQTTAVLEAFKAALTTIGATASTAASADQLKLSSVLCHLLNKCNAALTASVAKSSEHAKEMVTAVLADRVAEQTQDVSSYYAALENADDDAIVATAGDEAATPAENTEEEAQAVAPPAAASAEDGDENDDAPVAEDGQNEVVEAASEEEANIVASGNGEGENDHVNDDANQPEGAAQAAQDDGVAEADGTNKEEEEADVAAEDSNENEADPNQTANTDGNDAAVDNGNDAGVLPSTVAENNEESA